MLLTLLLSALLSLSPSAKSQPTADIPYSAATDEYSQSRCKLDVYRPDTEKKDLPVVVWFHGGGLTGGSKYIPDQLKDKDLIVVAVNYRLMPNVTIDKCIDDAATAVAWTFTHIKSYGGDPKKIIVSGHSAGGYLTAMVGLERKWLAKYDVNADDICALVPFSGQMITHFAHRDMNGIGNLQPTIDEFAPLYHVRGDCSPIVLITGDRELELFGRYEENAYMARMLKLNGHKDVTLYELDGFNHGTMVDPSFHLLLEAVAKYAR